jgi:WD40-like Beta Propeller Repeat
MNNDPKNQFDVWVLPMNGAREAQSREGTAVGNASPARSAIPVAGKLKEERGNQEITGDRKPFVFLNTRFDDRAPRFSPDSRWVAYQSNESGSYEIYVRPFPGPGGQWQVSTSGGSQPVWRADGKELFYVAPDGRLMAAPIAAKDAAIQPGIPVALFQTRLWGGGGNVATGPQFDAAPDGRFLMDITTEDSTNSPVTLLLNWHPEPGK